MTAGSGARAVLIGALRAPLRAVSLVVFAAVPAAAQSVFAWPEVDVFARLNSSVRLALVATTVKDDGEATDGEFGVNVDLFVKPIRRSPTLMFRLDESKNRWLLIRTGYRYMPSFTGASAENRVLLEATVRTPTKRFLGSVLVSNRNRLDLRVIDGSYSWRYRNRLSIERELSIGPVRANPYLRFEIYYDSRHNAVTRTEAMSGAAFPITRFWELEAYFDYQLDTGSDPSTKTRAVGAVANFYF